MPELPEVETVRRGLQPYMEGSVVERVELRRPDLRFPFPERFAERIEGTLIDGLGRRAKYLLAYLRGPAPRAGDVSPSLIAVMHLGMSGSFRIEAEGKTQATPGLFHHERGSARVHDHVLFHLRTPDFGRISIVFNDPRRFGFMSLFDAASFAAHPTFCALGIEPTGNGLDGPALAAAFRGKSAPLKATLLDQTIIAGLGNIYVCEALWRAGLSPRRKAASLVRKDGTAGIRLSALALHVRETIAEAIEAGGSSLRDHRQADGSLGYFQHRFAVYDREDEACQRPGCRGIVQRIVQSGRSTFFCPVCQR